MTSNTANHEPRSLRSYYRDISRTSILTQAEEIVLARLVRKGDPVARENMITANLRLVVKIAKDYSRMGVMGISLSDLIAEGNVGLMKAVDRFDPESGFRFSTFASWWIKQAIRLALTNQSRTIRVPSHATLKLRSLRRVADLLAADLGHDPTVQELAEVTGLAPDQIEKIHQTTTCTQSLDARISHDDDSSSLVDLLADELAESPEEKLEAKMRCAELSSLLAHLTPAERRVVESRFGLSGNGPLTLDQISREIGIKRERVRQIQSQAISKMRRALLRSEDDLKKRRAPGAPRIATPTLLSCV